LQKKKKITKLYKVQVGAFTDRRNAERLVNELKSKGYDAFIKEE
jgi:N-acetylmuramoyl-L-alanine amidase